jgi:hypothetical protein
MRATSQRTRKRVEQVETFGSGPEWTIIYANHRDAVIAKLIVYRSRGEAPGMGCVLHAASGFQNTGAASQEEHS